MTITSLLKSEIRDVAAAEIVTQFSHAAIGTDNTTPTAGDTTLGTEVFLMQKI